jgi:hypothetical protein
MQSYSDEGSEGSELYDSEDEAFDEYVYEPEETSKTKYNIVICQLYNSKKHGIPHVNSGVEYHFITKERFKKFDYHIMDYYIGGYHDYNIANISKITPHDIFRNYKYIVTRPNNIEPEIAECLYLSGGECVSILKTFWIRLIQKKWKKIVAERKRVLKLRCEVKSLLYREINGKWPKSCYYYPQLKGMMLA